MSQKFNFFFNEFVNNSDSIDVDEDNHNIIMNGIFLTKIKDTKIKFKSLINYVYHENGHEIIKEKKKFDDFIRLNLPDLIYKNLIKHVKIDKSISYAIERLFFHPNNSIFDLNLFFTQNSEKLKGSDINIYYGGEYRLTETTFFLYFLNLVINSKPNKIIFITRNRNISLKKFTDIKDFLDEFEVNETLVDPKFNLYNQNCKNILFVDGLRKKNFWIQKLNPLKVSTEETYKENFISYKQTSKLTLNELQLCKKFIFENKININDFKNMDFNFNSPLNYFSILLSKIILNRFKDIMLFCNKKLDFEKFDNLFIPASPLFEIIPIVNEMKMKNKNIYLLPHSSTPSFEYHPDTYKNQITFISAKKIMPSSNWHNENKKKELIISNNFFNINLKNKEKSLSFFTKIKKYNVFINYKLIIDKVITIIKNKLKYLFQTFYLNFFLNTSKNIGLVLNVEIYENLVDIDFNKQNDLIVSLYKSCLEKDLNLLIRRKPSWSNFYLLKQKLSKNFLKNELRNIILLEDSFDINNFFKNVRINIFFQGSTAIYESIKRGTPCVQLIDTKLLLINEQYVDFPDSVVPKLSISEIRNIISDKEHIKKLLEKQLQFIKNEEQVDVKKISSLSDLKIG